MATKTFVQVGIRIPPALHAEMVQESRAQGISLTQAIIVALQAYISQRAKHN